MARIPRREEQDSVPEPAQVMYRMLQGNCEAVQQRGGVAGEKPYRH
jgi:hypothetical protein